MARRHRAGGFLATRRSSSPPPSVPENLTLPTIDLGGRDAPQPGFAVHVEKGTWSGTVSSVTLTLHRGSNDAVLVADNNSFDYYPPEAVVGDTFYALEVAHNEGGDSDPAVSAETEVVNELGYQSFHPHAFWNQPIPEDATVRSDSATLVANILANGGEGEADTNIDGISNGWSCPIYLANASTTWVRVYADDNPSKYIDIPKEPTWYPAADDDHKYMAIDPISQMVYSVWDLRYRDLGAGAGFQWYSGFGSFGAFKYGPLGDSYTGYGQVPSGGGWGGRATSWNYLGGLILPGEMAAGVIEHALAFIVPGQVCRPSVYKFPAKATDGYSEDGASSIQEGMRVRLDPAFDISGATAHQQVIGECLKTYGAWLGDTGSLNGLNARMYMAVGGGSTDSTNWTGILAASDFPTAWLDHLQVLDDPDREDIYLEGTPSNTTPPSISTSTPAVGVELTVTQAVWDRYVDTRALQLRYADNETVIASGSGTFTYTPVSGDAGHALYAREIGTSAGNASSVAESSDTSAVDDEAPELPTPILMIDPSDTSTTFQDTAGTTPATANGQTVARVTNKGSQSGVTISKATDHQPTLAVPGQNGLNGIVFSGDQWLTITGLSRTARDYTLFLAIVASANVTDAQYILDVETGRLIFQLISPDVAGQVGYSDGTAGGYQFGAATTGFQILQWNIIAGTGTTVLYRNNSQVGVGKNNTARALGGQMAIGARFDGSSGRLVGTLCQLNLYDTVVSGAEASAVYASLNDKWT